MTVPHDNFCPALRIIRLQNGPIRATFTFESFAPDCCGESGCLRFRSHLGSQPPLPQPLDLQNRPVKKRFPQRLDVEDSAEVAEPFASTA